MADENDESGNDDKKDDDQNKAAEALRIAKELEEKLKNSGDQADKSEELDPAELINSPDFKAKAKELTGMTDAQVDFVIKTANAASAAANEVAAIAQVKAAHPADFSKFEKVIKEELKNYPVDKRGNASIIEKLYYVEKGKEIEKDGNWRASGTTGGMRTSIRGGAGPTGEGLDRSGRGASGAEALTDEERYVARKMGVKESDYAKAKKTKLVNDLIE